MLTNFVRDKSKPEAGMATGYMIEESLGFCTKYFSLYPHTRRRMWDPEEEMRDSGEVLLGRSTPKRLSYQALVHAHDYVIKNSVHTSELLRYSSLPRFGSTVCWHLPHYILDKVIDFNMYV